MATKTIQLSQPVEMHGKRVTEIVLNEPTGGQYLDFGEPRTVVNASGGLFYTENDAVISAYLDACVKHEAGVHVLRLLSLTDAMNVKKALLGFFTDAAQASSG